MTTSPPLRFPTFFAPVARRCRDVMKLPRGAHVARVIFPAGCYGTSWTVRDGYLTLECNTTAEYAGGSAALVEIAGVCE